MPLPTFQELLQAMQMEQMAKQKRRDEQSTNIANALQIPANALLKSKQDRVKSEQDLMVKGGELEAQGYINNKIGYEAPADTTVYTGQPTGQTYNGMPVGTGVPTETEKSGYAPYKASIDQILRGNLPQGTRTVQNDNSAVFVNPITGEQTYLGSAKTKYVKGSAQPLEGDPMTEDSLNNIADIFNATGNMPALGMGNASVRTQILNRAAERASNNGQTPEDLVSNRINYRANSQAAASSSGVNSRLQDAKVNQAIDLKGMLDQNYDPKTGTYNIPPALHSELVLGLARLLAPTGQVGIEMMRELKQKTAREGLAGGLIYLGFDPKEVGGSTQDVIKMFAHTIDRQGEIAEDLRDGYYNKNAGVGNSYRSFRDKNNTAGTSGGTATTDTSKLKVGDSYQGGTFMGWEE
jgi:hypothetical protein